MKYTNIKYTSIYDIIFKHTFLCLFNIIITLYYLINTIISNIKF